MNVSNADMFYLQIAMKHFIEHKEKEAEKIKGKNKIIDRINNDELKELKKIYKRNFIQ